MSRGVPVLALLCAASFGAIVRVALASDNNHVACVEHGFYAGSSATDGSYFSRVYPGCGSNDRYCALVDASNPSHPVLFISTEVYNSTGTCNSWSRDAAGTWPECTAIARVSDPGVFALHDHPSYGGPGC